MVNTGFLIMLLLIFIAIQGCRHLGHLFQACPHPGYPHLEWCPVWCPHGCPHQVCLSRVLACLPWGCPLLVPKVSGLSIARQMDECTTITQKPCSQPGSGPRRWTKFHHPCKACCHQVCSWCLCNYFCILQNENTFTTACTEVGILFNLRSTIAAKHGDNGENGAEIANSIYNRLFIMPLNSTDQLSDKNRWPISFVGFAVS